MAFADAFKTEFCLKEVKLVASLSGSDTVEGSDLCAFQCSG